MTGFNPDWQPVARQAQAQAGTRDPGKCFGREVTILGTNRADRIIGTQGDDVIKGKKGRDLIKGKGGDDVLCGQRGRDRLFGNAGDDILIGGKNRGFLDGGEGADRLFGGTPTAPDIPKARNTCVADHDELHKLPGDRQVGLLPASPVGAGVSGGARFGPRSGGPTPYSPASWRRRRPRS